MIPGLATRDDPALPTLADAADPSTVAALFAEGIDGFAPAGAIRLNAVDVVHHKPGRRCLIRYALTVEHPEAAREVVALGKIRRNRPGHHQLRLLRRFWEAGFDDGAIDAIRVPRPLGIVPALSMWLQELVPGCLAAEQLCGSNGAAVGARLADAANKVHTSGVTSHKRHTIADEVAILDGCLDRVGRMHPDHAADIAGLAERCRRAAARMGARPTTGIHRDYYQDQVIVSGDSLIVIDFDLHTMGDPALDIGNLLGHLTEQALRDTGDPDALSHVEAAVVDRYLTVAGPAHADAVRTYHALTLARHVFLAAERPQRAHLTARLLDLASERVSALS